MSMRRIAVRGLLVNAALLAVLLVALALMGEATGNSARFGELYSWLLVGSALGFVLLAFLIGRNLWDLYRQVRNDEPGSRLTLRLFVLFSLISVAPVSVVYYFSVQFIARSIDSWFDVRVEKALEDALELSRTALDLRMREVLKQTVRLAGQLGETPGPPSTLLLAELREESDAQELAVLKADGTPLVVAASEAASLVPERPPDVVLAQLRQGGNYVALDPTAELGFQLRAVVPVPAHATIGDDLLLQALYPVTDRFNSLGHSVQAAFDAYRELVFLREPLRTTFIMTLSLVLLFGVLSALSAAVYFARKFVQPVRDLADGTRAVAAGQYDKQLAPAANDELGFLVQSFNEMTRNLASARDSALQSRHMLEG
ncbi:MAG TPA: HAMP domain-containing protein, partial [Plasticicumulans sp.]|nr:HAMP domain-containing protein [Plasticicumulans sp.]